MSPLASYLKPWPITGLPSGVPLGAQAGPNGRVAICAVGALRVGHHAGVLVGRRSGRRASWPPYSGSGPPRCRPSCPARTPSRRRSAMVVGGRVDQPHLVGGDDALGQRGPRGAAAAASRAMNESSSVLISVRFGSGVGSGMPGRRLGVTDDRRLLELIGSRRDAAGADAGAVVGQRRVARLDERLVVKGVGRHLVGARVEREARCVVGQVVDPLRVDLEGDLDELAAVPLVAAQAVGSTPLSAVRTGDWLPWKQLWSLWLASVEPLTSGCGVDW